MQVHQLAAVAGLRGGRAATRGGGTAAVAGGRPAERAHARGDLGPQHLAAHEREPHRPAAGDHARVVHAEPLADEKQRGRGLRVDPRGAVPADQLRRQVGHAGVEEFEAAGRVLGRDLGLERLQRQLPLQLLDAAQQPGQLAVPVAVGAPRAGGGARPHRLHRPRQEHRLPHALLGGPGVGERIPVGPHVERDEGHERRHHDDRHAFPLARLEAALRQVAVGGRAAADRLRQRGEGAPRRG